MKKVLVTGATGFIGGHIIPKLLSDGFEVVATSVTAEKAKAKSWFDKVVYIPFDIGTVSPNDNYYNYFQQPDLVIHLAWGGLPNYNSPYHLEENLPIHYQFLSNLIKHGLRDITITGTCFEYGKQEGRLSEDMHAMPSNYYAQAKNRLRVLMTELNNSCPFTLKWVRLFYMYGEGQNPNSLFSQLQRAIERGDTTFNMSPGDQLRDFLDIKTVADYLVAIAVQDKVTGIINCCSGKPVEVKKLVADYLKQHNKDIKLNLGYYPYSDLEPRNFWGDNSKLKSILING